MRTLALLSMQEDENVDAAAEAAIKGDPLAEELSEQRLDAMEADQVEAVVENAQDDSEVLDSMAKLVEGAEDGIDPIAAEAIKIAVEAIQVRCGHKKGLKISTEGFAKPAGKKASSLALAQEMRQVQAKIDKQVSIAQEGIADAIKTGVEKMFTNQEKIKTRLDSALSLIEERGVREGEITPGAWVDYFNIRGSNNIDGKEALASLDVVKKAIDSEKFEATIKELTKFLKDIKDDVRSCWFFSNEAAVKNIQKVADQAEELHSTIEELVDKSLEADPGTVVALTKEEAKKLADKIEGLAFSSSLQASLKEFKSATIKTRLWTYYNQTFWRTGGLVGGVVTGSAAISAIGGLLHSDIRAAWVAMQKIGKTANAIRTIMASVDDVAFGAVKYIEASVGAAAKVEQ